MNNQKVKIQLQQIRQIEVYLSMIKIEKIVILILALLTLIDSVFLIKYMIIHSQTISKTSHCRLITFTLCHFYFAFMLGIQYQFQDQPSIEEVLVYKHSQWLVNTFVPIATIDTFIQIALFVILGTQKNLHTSPIQHEAKDQQLHLINFYFLIYMYSTILGILATLYLGVNKMLQKFQKSKYQDLVKDILDNYLYEYDEKDYILRDKQCSICQFGVTGHQNHNNQGNDLNLRDDIGHRNGQDNKLNGSKKDDKVEVVCLQCDHMFHKQCILQWVKKTYQQSLPARCPNCRQNINR